MAKGQKPTNAWLPGQSGNPAGRPKDGESWSGALKDISGKSSEELIALVGGPDSPFGKRMKELPRAIQIKFVANLNAIITLCQPTKGRYDKPFNASLYAEVMNRIEGKVPDKLVAGVSNIPTEMFEEILNEVYFEKK